jgi:DNA-binding PadR family transcriptional regulator
MHGYQLMQAIADRSGGRWSPSPGAIYPTLNQLEDEGLVTITADSGRKLVTLTETGRQAVTEAQENRPDPFAEYPAAPGADLRRILHQLHSAARSVAMGGNDDQVAAAAVVLKEARRSLYLILAGPEGDSEEALDA